MSVPSSLAEPAALVGPPPLRLLPAPASEPPFDDELTGSTPSPLPLRRRAAGVLSAAPAPTDLPLPAPVETDPLPALRLVPDGADRLGDLGGDDDAARPRTPLSQLPPARPFAHALVQRLLEVVAGLRPMSQLQRDTSFELFEELERRLLRRPRATGLRPTARDVRSVHVQDRADGVAEVCATVRRDGRTTALALRLEGVEGRWRCTELLGL